MVHLTRLGSVARRAAVLAAGMALACGVAAGTADAAQTAASATPAATSSTAPPVHAGSVRPDYAPCGKSSGTDLWAADTFTFPTNYAYCVGNYEFIAQGDGNFVIYNSAGNTVWASGTNRGFGMKDIIQMDGNFVIYNGGVALWATNTAGYSNATLCMQVDGNLVVYAYGGSHICKGPVLWARFY